MLDDAGWGVGNHALIAFGPRIAIRISGSRSSQRSQGRARDLDQESDTSFERSSARGDLRGKTGGIETMEAPIHVSNVALIDPKSKKPTRIGFVTKTVKQDGVEITKKVRVSKKSGEEI